MGMRAYPDYRDSGVDWLGDMPEHWTLEQLGRIGRFFKGGGGTKADEVEDGVSCVRYGDLYTEHQFLIKRTRAKIPEEKTGSYTALEHGDVLFAGSGETVEEIGKSAANLIAGPAYCGGDVILFRPSIETNATFLGYAADCAPAAYQKSCMGRGVTVMHIYSSELKYMLVPLPPLSEQRTIAAFLDRETGRIDALVEKKRSLIERLEEYRTALITRTVTRGLPPEAARAAGLDPSPRLKSSGVDWLGDVPEHWETSRLARVITCLDGRRIPLNSEQRGEFQGEYPYWGANGVLDYVAGWLFDEPLVLLGEDGAPFFDANKRVAFSVSGKIWVNNHAHVLRPTGIHPEFLTHVLNITEFVFFIDGSTRDKLTQGRMNSIPVPLPPIHEQREISDFLHQEAGQIDSLVERVETNIERLEEHRTALITAAVTGKIDVREQVSYEATGTGGAA